LVQLLTLIAGAAVFVLSVLIGGIVLAGLVGFILLMLVVIYVRVWWLQRKVAGAARSGGSGARRSEEIVDAEYRVIDITERDEKER